MNASQDIKLFPRGHPAIREHHDSLPAAWNRALSPGSSPEEAVFDIWQPLVDRARGFVTRLSVITLDFALAMPADRAARPGLLYVLPPGDLPGGQPGEPAGWVGGYPLSEEAVHTYEQSQLMTIPAAYRSFLQVHNGFTKSGQEAVGFIPLEGLQKRYNRLAFWEDESGNQQYFDMSAPSGRGDYETLLWAPTAQGTRKRESFWSFLKELTVRGVY